MPSKKICRCGKLIDVNEKLCPSCKKRRDLRIKEYDKQRGSSYERGYDSRWRKYRKQFLKQNPLCVECLNKNKYMPATVVDHIIPHKGDVKLFWDTKNHQSLCKKCHDAKTAREDGGFGNRMAKG
jgi:5-methylcytosine-specific restriction protein A